MLRSAREAAQAARFVAVLSLDDPMNVERPWRWFLAAGWLSTAVMSATDGPLPEPLASTPLPDPIPEPEATP